MIFPDLPLNASATLILFLVSTGYYYVILLINGFAPRFVQSMTAMLGADVLLTLIYTVVYLVLLVLADRSSALVMILLISYWSVPVQGHIIARAIQRHWLIGIGIAIVAHLLMLTVYRAIASPP